jgi:hypothetical protein
MMSVFIPGAEVISRDGWRGTVLQQCPRSVVCLALDEVPNDDLRGYRVWPTGELSSVFDPVGAALDRRQLEPIYSGRKRPFCSLALRQRDVWRWPPAHPRQPLAGAQYRPAGAPARRRSRA